MRKRQTSTPRNADQPADQPQRPRQLDLTQRHARHAREQRVSNRPPQAQAAAAAPPVTITISDGPAPTHIRTANQYHVGDTVRLHCEVTQGTAASIVCTIRQPDGTAALPTTQHPATTYRPTQPGQHWYAFDAYDVDDHRLASSEAIFLVQAQHVAR